MMILKTVDLCAGIGGIRRGFELAGGYTNVASAEIDRLACATYEALFHQNPQNDVTNKEFKKSLIKLQYDVLMAGFPCQAFSSVGLQQGFEDKTKGTIFFDIAQIIQMTQPKILFLENVQNLLIHDHRSTIMTIMDTLDRQLNYHVIGLKHDKNGNLLIHNSSFIRNSKNFGVPQNRPRVYIVAFNRRYFGDHISLLPDELPTFRNRAPVFEHLSDILEKEVDKRYFLSAGYLETLEKHIINQSVKGYGFGYRIVNAAGIKEPVANTLLATGGSGRERNLIYDPVNGQKYAGATVDRKKSPINSKCIRTMTPTEWGRLQGFIGYAFIDENGADRFSFPEGVPNVEKYKQLGNSVTIPVVEEMARFIYEGTQLMTNEFTDIEKRKFSMYGNEFLLCDRIEKLIGSSLREKSLNKLFNLVYHFSGKQFRTKDVAAFLNISAARASQILKQLADIGCVDKQKRKDYQFSILTESLS